MRTRLTARYVVGFDGTDHVVHHDGEVVYEDDVVIFVGHCFDGQVDLDIDEGLALIGPGFIDLNALGDIDHAIFDTYQDAQLGPGLGWSREYASHRHAVFDREQLKAGRRHALGQLLINGITTALPIAAEIYQEWSETYQEMIDCADVAGDLGIRAYLGPSYRSSVPVVESDGQVGFLEDTERGITGLRNAAQFVQDIHGARGGLIHGMLAPSRIENQTLDQLRETRRLSDELRCPVRLHAGQTLHEVQVLNERHGMRPIELLDSVGFLGPRTLIAHGWAVDGHSQLQGRGREDLDRLLATGSTVVFCPMAIGRYAVVLESFDRYVHHGIRVAMGTDTAPPDMIRAMDTGMLLTKAVERARSAGNAADLYRSATLHGAAALGRPDLGRLEAGAQADVVVIDFSNPHFGPVDDPIRSLIMNGNGRDVRRVVVAGRTVVDGGRLVGDTPDLRYDVQGHLDDYRASYCARDYRGRSEDSLFPATFRAVRPSR